VQTTADTVAKAVAEAGQDLYAADLFDPPADAPIAAGMAIKYTPSVDLALSADGAQIRLRAAAGSVGEALAEAGVPLIGLDVSQPSESQPPPENRAVKLTRVSEASLLAQKAIAFTDSFQDSPVLGLGQEQTVQAGVNGLTITRTRVRYEDGSEASRISEAPAVVRPAQDRIVARGTKILEQTSNINGVPIQYWLKTQMYATVYSPCDSASGDPGKCSYGTASGLRAGKGVVAVDPALYSYLNGQRLYIPGYGNAVIGDLGGGYIVERNLGISRYKWIDLGFDDSNMEDLTGWITVYFLAPAPASIPDALK
jgi:3D (Asp-Asp-Asp) domain-containing protein